jgi:hypothetical protein
MNIPILILSFNHLTYLRNVINWFRSHYPNSDIYIIDNASSYPPLLEYLSDIHGKDNIYVFTVNFGEGAINIKCFIDRYISNNYENYIISDPYVMPHMTPPVNFLTIFRYCNVTDEMAYYYETADGYRCFCSPDITQFVFKLQQMGFFNYLPDKIMESFYDLPTINEFYRFLSWEDQDLKEKIYKALNGTNFTDELGTESIDKMINTSEALKIEFTDVVIAFMKSFRNE